MCPVVLLSLIFSVLLFLFEVTSSLVVTFSPTQNLTLTEQSFGVVNFTIYDQDGTRDGLTNNHEFEIAVKDDVIADVTGNRTISLTRDQLVNNYTSYFTISGKFLGKTSVSIKPKDKRFNSVNDGVNSLDIIVKRKQTTISLVFTISVAVLVSLNYINMGCALETEVVKTVLRRPIAPALGFLSQYLVMPSVTYLLGYLLLREWPHLRLGLFVFGCSPAGGASNMWTVLLKGNLDLSVTMTLISTLAAVGMLPLWMFALGKQIYAGTTTTIPFRNILTTMVSMTLCLGIGLLFQRFLPRVAKICKRILAPVSIGMIIFIIIFGTYANLYMFKLMNWRILLAAGFSVWIGFSCGYLLSTSIRLPMKDRIAISIETGIQNTGTAIVLLGFSLPDPDNDISAVVPVAASIMTPIPLTIVWIAMKCYAKYKPKQVRDGTSKSSDSPNERRTINGSTVTLLPSPSNSIQVQDQSVSTNQQAPNYLAI